MVLNYELNGTGQPLVFLHGLSSSLRSWQPFIEHLDKEKYQTLAIDLLGFGHSPKPRNITYDYQTHIASLLKTIKAAGVKKPVVLIGHSMGGLLSLRLAAENPKLVKKVIIYGLPFFPTAEITKREITKGKLRLRLAYYGPASHALCTVWCRILRPISKHLAPYYLPKLPKQVAEDSVLHSWRSYSQSRDNLIAKQIVPSDLDTIRVPVTLIYGEGDRCKNYLEPEGLLRARKNVELVVVKNLNHQLPHRSPEILTNLI